MRKEMLVVGKRIPMTKKINAYDKVTGRSQYTEDLKLPGMLYAKILRSPYAHAIVVKVDGSRAEKLPGVRAVLTYRDVPNKPYGIGPPPMPQDTYTLPPLGGKVRYVGDPVAAVAADSVDIAEEALELIDVEYKELPAVLDPEEAMNPDSEKIHPWGRFPVDPMIVNFGDVEIGFKEADYVFEGTYRVPIQCHTCLEPHSCVASWDTDGKLTVQLGCSGPFSQRKGLSRTLSIPEDNIRVIVPPAGSGGSFGSKGTVQSFGLDIAAYLSRKAGRPVKLVFTRWEEFLCSVTRHAAVIWLKTGVKKDGTLTARHAKIIWDTGAYCSSGPYVYTRALRPLALYRCPNIKYDGFLVYTNKPVAGAMRGFGNPQATFAVEAQNDEIVETLGIDPVKWSLENHIQVGDVNIFPGSWVPGKLGGNNWIPALWKIDSCGLSECIIKGAERIGWGERKGGAGEVGKIKKIGIGMACGMHTTSGEPVPWISSAYVRLMKDGTIELRSGGCDHGGTGQHTIMAQIIAEELGVPLENITVIAEDTDAVPFDSGTAGASGGTFVVGGAVLEAVNYLKKKILRRAATPLRARVEKLEIREGRVLVRGNPECAPQPDSLVLRSEGDHTLTLDKRGLSFAEIAKWTMNETGPYSYLEGFSYYRRPGTNAPPFIANFAKVEVDTETGQVKVLKLVAAHDSGRAMNRMFYEGQVEGGAHQGIGYGLTENLLFNMSTGEPLNPRFLDYIVLSAVEMPEIEVIIVETDEPEGPLGAKGLGEPAMIATAPAIVNAIYNAIGVRIKEIPITPEKILKALREEKNRLAQ